MSINRLRDEIDEIDIRIVALLNDRAALVRRIGSAKAAAGLPVTDLARELDVYRRLLSTSDGTLGDDALIRIYETIIRECREIQASTIARPTVVSEVVQ